MRQMTILIVSIVIMCYLGYMMIRNRKVFTVRMKMLDVINKRAEEGVIPADVVRMAYNSMSYDDMMAFRNSFTPVETMVKEWEERIDMISQLRKPQK